MRPDTPARAEFEKALGRLAGRIADSLRDAPPQALPVRMFVAGGAALHHYTGERITDDVDASFSHRIALPADLDIAYRDPDGGARLLYFDRNYSDTLALLHETAYDDSRPLALPGVDAAVLDVRVLAPVDLAVSKLGRFSAQDRDDIAALARHGLVDAAALRVRATEALRGFVGNLETLRTSIDLACRVVEANSPR